ncbi:hypothetical protein O181_035744 [Austropuccinia psidii MF-1]|uniref:Uncharacterized protein n=1 Tax=Austropuccinia psidii MF-1 TaxID=1389203 RepID=A0A9Q3HAU7_9BASI|nr:hypothetical protein [Austropuccinia psidii MF-1]
MKASKLITKTVVIAINLWIPISSRNASDPFSIFQQSSHLLFASAASLLQQAPNSYFPNGHSIVPGTIPTGTLLYHACSTDQAPTGFEWLAFDPEMSYGVVAGRGGPAILFTYLAKRPLRVIYFDGNSGALRPTGWLDSQYLLFYSEIPTPEGSSSPELMDDYSRAKEMCEQSQQWGFEGVVRMNVGFEVIWCDFTMGLELIRRINITDPFSSPGYGFPPTPDSPDRAPEFPAGGLSVFPSSPFAITAPWEWQRSATWHYESPGEARVQLDYSSMVSFYDGVDSLARKRIQDHTVANRREQRLLGISPSDVKVVQARLRKILAQKEKEGWTTCADKVDWKTLLRTITNHYSGRLNAMSEVLNLANDHLNATAGALSIRQLTYGALMPYFDMADDKSNLSDSGSTTLSHCSKAFTKAFYFTSLSVTPSEKALIGAIEGTLTGLCQTLIEVFVETIEDFSKDYSMNDILRWKNKIENLIKWLGWPEWHGCSKKCGKDVSY